MLIFIKLIIVRRKKLKNCKKVYQSHILRERRPSTTACPWWWWGQRYWNSAAMSEQKSLVLARQAQGTNQGRTPFICTLWAPIHFSFTSQQDPPLSCLSAFYLGSGRGQGEVACLGATAEAIFDAAKTNRNISYLCLMFNLILNDGRNNGCRWCSPRFSKIIREIVMLNGIVEAKIWAIVEQRCGCANNYINTS